MGSSKLLEKPGEMLGGGGGGGYQPCDGLASHPGGVAILLHVVTETGISYSVVGH